MNKKKFSAISIALYVFAVLLVLYTAWALYHSIRYISETMAQNQLVFSGNEYDIVSFYMANCAQYILFAIILFTLGWMLQINSFDRVGKHDTENQLSSSRKTSDDETKEEDFEEWFRNNNT